MRTKRIVVSVLLFLLAIVAPLRALASTARMVVAGDIAVRPTATTRVQTAHFGRLLPRGQKIAVGKLFFWASPLSLALPSPSLLEPPFARSTSSRKATIPRYVRFSGRRTVVA